MGQTKVARCERPRRRSQTGESVHKTPMRSTALFPGLCPGSHRNSSLMAWSQAQDFSGASLRLSSSRRTRTVLEKHAKYGTGVSPRPQVTLLKARALDSVCVRGHMHPSPDLCELIAVAWTLEWNLPQNQAFTQAVLPNPSVQ